MLIAIVLISILNVMIMAVYERVREIGTIAAIGTKPGRIMSLFLMEGLALGVSGSMMGTLLSVLTIWILNLSRITFSFGRQVGLVLAPTISASEVVTACLLVIVIAVVASLQPAYMASKIEPVEALRHV
jgi:putative ABC transport system permease protein